MMTDAALIDAIAQLVDPGAWPLTCDDPAAAAGFATEIELQDRRATAIARARLIVQMLLKRGYKIVPREPTEAMIRPTVMQNPLFQMGPFTGVWHAMWDAA